jgi:beta-N-acetylhexosaminidase
VRAAPTAAIVGLSGPTLTADEAALLRAHKPTGIILFGRNILDPPQLARLVAQLRELLPAKAILMLDQEGGRVARLRPPHWRAHPAAAVIGALHGRDRHVGLRAAWQHGALIGAEARAAGFDVVTAPVLDLRLPGASDVVGDRAFSDDPHAVAALGRAMADGLLAAGVQPVAKHAPGHGQAAADSHVALPVVDAFAPENLVPFQANRDVPWMMTAHVRYPALDPDRPATLSAPIVADIIRTKIGFAGVLVSDDLAMSALTGPPELRALAALAAGCDLALYCPGDPAGTDAVLRACPPVTAEASARLTAARALAAARTIALDAAAMHTERSALLA